MKNCYDDVTSII